MRGEEAYGEAYSIVGMYAPHLLDDIPHPDDLDAGWVSVEEMVPEEGQKVLILLRQLRKDESTTQAIDYLKDGKWQEESPIRELMWDVTHWQPLPAPPKGEPS